MALSLMAKPRSRAAMLAKLLLGVPAAEVKERV